MSVALQLAIIPASIGTLLAVMVILKRLSRRLDLSAEVQRKTIHICTGIFAMTFPWLFPDKWPVFILLALTLVVMAVLRMPTLSGSGIGSTLHGVERQSHGDVLLVFAIGAIFLLSDGDPLLYGLPIAVLTLSDAAAALAGSTYGRRFFAVADGAKSLEGVAVFFLVTWILAMSALLLFSAVERESVLVLSLMIAAFGALVEADSWRGYDNLFVPLGVFLLASSGLAMTLSELVGLALFLVVAVLVCSVFAIASGISAHTARIYLVAIFLIMVASTMQNAILPVIALGAHVAARWFHRCKADFPDLDIVASIAIMSVLWLVGGTIAGSSSINFYGLTFVGLALLLGGLATTSLPVLARVVISFASAAGLVLVYVQIVRSNGPEAGWAGDPAPAIALTILLCAALSALAPGWFEHRRGPKTAMVASLVPAGFYLANIVSVAGWA